VRNERQNEEAVANGGPAGCGVTGWLPWRGPMTTLVWALTAAVLYGTGAALQQRQAAATPRQAAGRPRLLLLLVRRPWWLLGIGVELGGFATHAVALRTGPLTIVQMLVASSLLFSVATIRLWSGRRLSWTAWAAVLAVIAGVASFVALASPADGDSGVPSVSGHAGLAAACLAACAVPLAAAGLAAAGSRRAVLLAVAARIADAGIADVTMAFSHVVSGGLTGMVGSWATYALMLGGPCSLLLTQTAYQAGRQMITLPVIAVVTPVASLAVGNLLLGESAHLGVLSGAVAALAVLVTLAGLMVLARLTTGQPGPVGDRGSSVTLPSFPTSGSRSGPGLGPAGRAPAARQSPARRRLRRAATSRVPRTSAATHASAPNAAWIAEVANQLTARTAPTVTSTARTPQALRIAITSRQAAPAPWSRGARPAARPPWHPAARE
jgi:drug/metabolite transporter (DMT)-like permease